VRAIQRHEDQAMSVLLLRGLPVSIAAGSVLVAGLALAGCAIETVQSDVAAQTRVAAMEQRPAEERTAPTKPKQNIAAAKKKSAHTVAAKEPPLRQPGSAGSEDEASCTRVEDCASVLKAMVASSDRSWVQRPATPAVLSNGVRLFAYRALAPKLGCNELAMALTEVETATQILSHPVAGLQPEQLLRTKSLSSQVGDELRAERSQRCAAQAKEAPGAIPWAPQG
jgi:hypothetical protein